MALAAISSILPYLPILGGATNVFGKAADFIGGVLGDIGKKRIHSFSDFGRSLASSASAALMSKTYEGLGTKATDMTTVRIDPKGNRTYTYLEPSRSKRSELNRDPRSRALRRLLKDQGVVDRSSMSEGDVSSADRATQTVDNLQAAGHLSRGEAKNVKEDIRLSVKQVDENNTSPIHAGTLRSATVHLYDPVTATMENKAYSAPTMKLSIEEQMDLADAMGKKRSKSKRSRSPKVVLSDTDPTFNRRARSRSRAERRARERSMTPGQDATTTATREKSTPRASVKMVSGRSRSVDTRSRSTTRGEKSRRSSSVGGRSGYQRSASVGGDERSIRKERQFEEGVRSMTGGRSRYRQGPPSMKDRSERSDTGRRGRSPVRATRIRRMKGRKQPSKTLAYSRRQPTRYPGIRMPPQSGVEQQRAVRAAMGNRRTKVLTAPPPSAKIRSKVPEKYRKLAASSSGKGTVNVFDVGV